MGDPLHRTSQGERSMLGKAEKLSVLVVFELRLIILILFYRLFEALWNRRSSVSCDETIQTLVRGLENTEDVLPELSMELEVAVS
ncbi:hypothetical protein RXP20_09050 [Pseudomonas aeruginosa]|nr:hypothetical protein [Pseudomonas aeruginosa]